MRQDQLYAYPNLSLQKLARYLAISPNYISQALNETLTVNFFDFVNQWRTKGRYLALHLRWDLTHVLLFTKH
jgi:YesN/AraC family two-component response regulator